MPLSVLLPAALALAVGLVLLARRRRSRARERLRLYRVMRLRGAWLPQTLDEAAADDVAAAERRCGACSNKALCDEMLRTGRSRRYGLFCPNALYVEWLRSCSLRFD